MQTRKGFVEASREPPDVPRESPGGPRESLRTFKYTLDAPNGSLGIPQSPGNPRESSEVLLRILGSHRDSSESSQRIPRSS